MLLMGVNLEAQQLFISSFFSKSYEKPSTKLCRRRGEGFLSPKLQTFVGDLRNGPYPAKSVCEFPDSGNFPRDDCCIIIVIFAQNRPT